MASGALVWIRRDLRLEDHRALSEATAKHDRVAVAFVYDSVILDQLVDRDDRRLTFIHQSLDEVATNLRDRGSDLITRVGDPVEIIPQLAKELGVEHVYANHDDDPYALRRDESVSKMLVASQCGFTTFKDCVVFERDEIVKDDGSPYRVYTPYSKAWKNALRPADYAEFHLDQSRFWPADQLPKPRGNQDIKSIGFESSDLIVEPGTSGAKKALAGFEKVMPEYGKARDFPDRHGTSMISVHLRHGTISVRECVRLALSQNNPGATKWLNELIWRDFYHMILAQFPFVVDDSFRPEYR
ncbi:MAG: deoxyribodipyrimidine photo-lyase, partial [Fimbriimonadaceae bacterium]|nr:deoxyribodipyrimidine photo-lyase [Fimbriimonadaceae bacterium]